MRKLKSLDSNLSQTVTVEFAACTRVKRALGARVQITRECWEQHVEEGTFNLSSSRKYTAEDCGEVPSFEVSGKKISTPADSTSVNAAANGRLPEWLAQGRRSTVHSTHLTEWSTSERENA